MAVRERPTSAVARHARRGAIAGRVAYLARIARVYGTPGAGPLSFWHEDPLVNETGCRDGREYYMRFQGKANYQGPFDDGGVPLLDYRGDIGRQHNPIAIAQYGLARFNRWRVNGADADRAAWLTIARWLVQELRPNAHGVPVWVHHFDWPYRQTLVAPWYSGLAQGCGLSMLVRAAQNSADLTYAAAADRAFQSFRFDVARGGVMATDDRGHLWIEEYLVDPPSHILNGFIWALWGVYDYAQWRGSEEAEAIWASCIRTLLARIPEYDTGWWSLYELPPDGAEPMLASRYYHRLHITQLHVLHRLTGNDEFHRHAVRFEGYLKSRRNRARALATKAFFKLRNY
jgi:hypothetical protein